MTENFNNLLQSKILQISSLNPDKYSLSPSYNDAYNNLALTLRFLGKPEEARAEAAAMLRINPKFSLERWAKTLPYKNQADTDLFIDALRIAGLK